MPTAILIGFEYEFNTLPGAIIDLYHAYKWCHSFNCDIHVLTDIQQIKDQEILNSSVNRKISSPDILTFYDNLSSKRIISNINDILTSLESLLDIQDNKLIIYYTGHGMKDSMVMPDKSLLSFIKFRDTVLQYLNKYVEIFWILDCCNPNGLNLPYKLTDNTFMLSPNKVDFITQPILLITSADANEKSVSTKLGSLFSRNLFKTLTNLNIVEAFPIIRDKIRIPTHNNRNLKRIIGNLASTIRKSHTGYSQTVSIYASYVMDPILWMWIGSCKSYDVVGDMTGSLIVVRSSIDGNT